MIARRVFLRDSGLAVLGLSIVPGFVKRAALAATPHNGREKILVVIFQRGGADGLNIVVPYGDEHYYEHRPTIALAPPGPKPESVLELDGFFGLHPTLAPLKEIYDAGNLAVVHAVGSSDYYSRSHFEAQDYWETAVPGDKTISTGWLNRYMTDAPDAESTAFRATSMGQNLPQALQGPAAAMAMGNINQVGLGPAGDLFQSLYDEETGSMLSGTAREMYEAIDLLKTANPSQYRPAPDAGYPTGGGQQAGFSRQMQQVAQLIKADIGLEIAFVDVGGWDHHTDEGNIDGRMRQSLNPIGQTLAAFYRDLSDRMEDIVVLTMSEFGRTVRENGNRGTDHGRGNFMFVMGGGVKGGKVYGDWPGLAPEQLNENRDLSLTTDFRDVFAEVLVSHLKVKDADTIFPAFSVDAERFKGLV